MLETFLTSSILLTDMIKVSKGKSGIQIIWTNNFVGLPFSFGDGISKINYINVYYA